MLKSVGETAHQAGVILSLETHVPYGHNADVALKTLSLVNSPGVGYNYDTANIYYYNEKGIDGIAELRKTASKFASIHLKESKGVPESMNLPILGTGIVDFREVFKILDTEGFNGPFTLELEGPLVNGLPVVERTAKVQACVDHLKSIGVMG